MNKKNILCLLSFLLIFNFLSAQKMDLRGEILGLQDTLVVFYYYQSNGVFESDTVDIERGRFRWQTEIPAFQDVQTMFLPSRKFTSFISENTTLYLNGRANAFEINITGSKVENAAVMFERSNEDLTVEKIRNGYRSYDASEKERKDIIDEFARLNELEIERTKKYLTDHPNDGLSLNIIHKLANTVDFSIANPLFEKLSDSLQRSGLGKIISLKLEETKKYAIGAPVLNFSLPDPEGKIVMYNSTFSGKFVLIDFWASWCGPCRAENPNVLRLYNKYKDKGFTVVGISLDTDHEKWKNAIKEDKLPWIQLSDLKGFENELARFYNINGIPFTMLVNPEGKIIAKGLRGDNLKWKLEELFD